MKIIKYSLLMLLVSCASATKPLYPVKMINDSSEEWNNRDIRTLNWIIKKDRCEIITSGRSPRVKKFIKRSTQNYWVICGRLNNSITQVFNMRFR